MKKINRNAPCPCGSGKKYKKCCLGKEDLNFPGIPDKRNDPILPQNIIFNYGKAKINSRFFKSYKVGEFSSFLFLQMSLEPKIFDLVDEYAKESKISNRCKSEANLIKNCNNIDDLLIILQKKPDPLNNKLLIDKILLYKDEGIPLVLNFLKNDISDEVLELIVKIIFYSKVECSNEIIELILNGNKRVYIISVLCFLLGFFNNKKSIQILWDHFYYFSKTYPDESYADGPFFALEKIYYK